MLSKSIEESYSKTKLTTFDIYSEEINLDLLYKCLLHVIPHFSSKEYDIIYTIFGKREEEFINLITNVKKFGRGDSLICYGNNNHVLKVILDNAIKTKLKDMNIKRININGYFDSNEELLLKEICTNLKIKSSGGYSNYKKSLELFFQNDNNDTIVVIYLDYIDHLVHKKKQRLLYNLFELTNASKNLLLIGFTYNYNLMDQMDKRIGSRYSHKTIYINIENFGCVINAIEKTFNQCALLCNKKNYTEEQLKTIDSYGKIFYKCLINEKMDTYIFYLEKIVNLGLSIEEILNKIKSHLVLCKVEIENYQYNTNEETIDTRTLIEIISNLTQNMIDNENRGYLLNMLLGCSKLQIILFICLISCFSRYKEKIILPTFYNKTKSILNKYSQRKHGYDLILIQKFLEELNNCNIISIRANEKYGKIYQLKIPLREIKKNLKFLKENNKLDHEMIKLFENIKW